MHPLLRICQIWAYRSFWNIQQHLVVHFNKLHAAPCDNCLLLVIVINYAKNTIILKGLFGLNPAFAFPCKAKIAVHFICKTFKIVANLEPFILIMLILQICTTKSLSCFNVIGETIRKVAGVNYHDNHLFRETAKPIVLIHVGKWVDSNDFFLFYRNIFKIHLLIALFCTRQSRQSYQKESVQKMCCISF